MEACSFIFRPPLSLAKMTGNKDLLDSTFQFSTPVNEDLLLWAEIQNIDQTKVSERHGSELDTTKVAKPPNRYEFQCSNSVNVFCADVGTTKNIRATRNSQLDRLSWTSEMPGDLHTGAFLEECIAKTQGPGGMYHIAHDILGRRNVTPSAFGKDKLKEGNLKQNKEAVHDITMGYGVVAVEFVKSAFFPKSDKLNSCNDITDALLINFKMFLSESAELDPCFAYYSEVLTTYGPLREWFYENVKFGNGISREVSWLILLPIFAQMGKKNYFTEALAYSVNFTCRWPLAIRKLVQQNCSLNISDVEGHNVAIDDFVETFLVQPLKQYVTGKTSLRVLQCMSANLDLVKRARKVHMSKAGLDIHCTKKHSVPDSFPDQLKVAWFCLKEQFFLANKSRQLKKIPSHRYIGRSGEAVRSDKVDVYSKGIEKVKKAFGQKLFQIFPDFR